MLYIYTVIMRILNYVLSIYLKINGSVCLITKVSSLATTVIRV